jgi:hypothetical protein
MSCPTAVLLIYPPRLMMAIPLECKNALIVTALAKIGFMMVVIFIQSRRRITKTKPELVPVLSSKTRGTLWL